MHMLRPLLHLLLLRLHPRDALFLAVLDEIPDPVHCVLDRSRDVAEHLVRTHDHHHVREAFVHEAEKGFGPAFPGFADAEVVDAVEVDGGDGACDGVEAGGVDEGVEFDFFACFEQDAFGGDLRDGRFVLDVYEADVGAVIGFEVVGF